MEDMLDEFCTAMELDLGKEKFIGMLAEVKAVNGAIDANLANIDEWASEVFVDTPILLAPGTSSIVPEPLGVVLVMSAWNYPVNLMLAPVV